MTSLSPKGYAMDLAGLAREYHAFEAVDKSAFRRRARVLQSMWREEHGYPIGEHRTRAGSRLLGSRLAMPWAKQTLANYLTPTIREVVRVEVSDPDNSRGKLYGKPRIFNDLLSSQPLCFNLFGELRQDLGLATELARNLTGARFREVTSIEFEHSPGRSDPRYTGDRSAFDVFLRCRTATGGAGFLGIEVKYHENLLGQPDEHRPRYDEIAASMACFRQGSDAALRGRPLQQIWRDHLLAGVTREVDEYDEGVFVFLYPSGNEHCRVAVEQYQACLTDESTFAAWTLENVVRVLGDLGTAAWIRLFRDRYLAFEKIDEHLARREKLEHHRSRWDPSSTDSTE